MGSQYLFTPVGAGGSTSASSGTGKNYLGTVNNVNNNGDFETGLTSPWSIGTVALTSNLPTGVPTFGSGASGNLSISAVTSGKLAGSYSLSYASSAATTAGNMLHSDVFTIDTEDQAKVMTFKFYYSPTVNSTNGNYSGTTSNSFGVAIYDVTNSAWIIPAGVFSMTQGSGVGYATGTFQTTSNGTQYRFVVYNANATAGAVTVLFDDVSLGPIGNANDGRAIALNASSAATTSMGTSDTQVTGWSATDDSVAGLSSNAYTIATTGYYRVSAQIQFSTQASSARGIVIIYKNGSSLKIGQNVVLNSTWNTTASISNVFKFNAGDVLTIYGSATTATALSASGHFWSVDRVAGPTSGDEGRVIAVSLSGTATTVNNTFPVITPSTIVRDTNAAFSGSTYAVPVSGWYDIFAYMQSNSVAFTSGNGISIAYKVNGGSTVNLGNTRIPASVTQAFSCSGAGLVYANAGDTIQFAAYSDVSNTPLIFTGSIARRSGPAVVAANESVNARYYGATATITVSDSIITWSTKDFDSHGAYSSGTYTAPVSGKFQINASLLVGGTFALNNGTKISIYKNGSEISAFNHQAGGAISSEQVAIHDEISCNAGDAITIRIASSATSPVVTASNTKNYFSIARVGN